MKDGGPAYPSQEMGQEVAINGLNPGMSLRDYFAGQALAGKCGYTGEDLVASEDLASEAYAIADAMLDEREKGGAE